MKKKVILMLCFGLLFITGCGKVPVLKNGEEVFFQIDGNEISANDVFSELKEKYGKYVLIDMIDNLLLEKKYEDNDDIKEYVASQVSQYVQQYGGEEAFANALAQAGMTQKEFEQQIALDYRRNLATEDYVKTTITDKEIEDYYESDIRGDIKASHILIQPDVDDSATEEEKTKAKEEALKKAKDLIKKLDDGEDFATLAKEHSSDGSAENGGDLGYFPKGKMVDAFEEASVKLEVGKYSKTPVESEFGYHIILKTDQKEKPALKEVKDTILDAILDQKLGEDSTLAFKALYEIRKEAGLEIHDDSVKKGYESYMKQLMSPQQ